MSKTSLRLLIDKEQKRVVFAEAGSDFIDVLFSFLTLPLGSIVQLLDKQSGLGSLDTLYESVLQLDNKYLRTKECKEMLLNPRSGTAIICEDLEIQNIHDAEARNFHICHESECLVQSICYYTYLTKARCRRCDKLMDKKWIWKKTTEENRGVFVNDIADFIITDDLRVKPISLMSGFSLLEELRIKNASGLEERVVDVGYEEALNLFRRSLVSNHALTEVFFPGACLEPSVKCFSKIKKEIDVKEVEKQIDVKIILNKKSNIALYAEVGEDFIDQLLSFLTFPLGSMFRLLGDHILLEGCIRNLYYSAESLGLEHFKSEKYKKMLVFPKLASHYGCRNQMLKFDEIPSKKWTFSKCIQCHLSKSSQSSPCIHGVKEAELLELNTKLESGGADSGGGFAKDQRRFMVSDNLHISPISSISSISAMSKMSKGIDILISDLIEKDVSLDSAKVLSLLNAMLISETVLTDVFFPNPTQRNTDTCGRPSKEASGDGGGIGRGGQAKRRRKQYGWFTGEAGPV